MINRLVLENWRSHEHSEFVFEKGTNVLIGIMGAGKSSAMNAVSFALFGTFPDLAAKKTKLDDVVMNKPTAKSSAKVSLDFNVGDTAYSVKREIKVGKGTIRAELWSGERLVEGPQPKRVDEKIQELLKIDYDLFSRAIYSEQNNMDYFLEIPKSQRKQKIDELLRIDRLENARKTAGTVTTRLTNLSKEYAAFAEKLPTTDAAALRSETAQLAQRAEKTSAELKQAEESLAKTGEEYAKLSSNKLLFEKLDNEARNKRSRLEALTERLREHGQVTQKQADVELCLKALENEKLQAQKAESERQKLERELEKTSGLIEKTRQNAAELEQKIRGLPDKNILARQNELKQALKAKNSEAENLVRQHAQLNVLLAQDSESIQKLENCGSACPVCETLLPDEKRLKILQEKQLGKTKKQEDAARLSSLLDSLKQNSCQVEQQLETVERQAAQLQQAEWLQEAALQRKAELADYEKRLADANRALSTMKSGRGLEQILDEHEQTAKLLDYFKTGEQAAQASEQLGKLGQQLAALNYNEALEKKCFENFKNAEKNAALKRQETENLGKLLQEKNKRLCEIEKLEKETREKLEQARQLKQNAEAFSLLQSALQKTQAQLRQDFIVTVNAALAETWKNLYPYADYTDLKLAVDDAGDYVLQLQRRDGAWINVEGTMSGGERSTACIALRVAFSLVLTQNLSWLVLDEPTHNLDATGVQRLAKTLREHLPKLVEQTFVITHEQELEAASTGCVYKLERNKQYDEPTRVTAENNA